jgi:hypothetical protein
MVTVKMVSHLAAVLLSTKVIYLLFEGKNNDPTLLLAKLDLDWGIEEASAERILP